MSERPRFARAASRLLTSNALAWAIVAAGALLRVAQYLANRSLWADESFLALNIVERSFGGLAAPLEHNQAAPLGFLALSKLAVVLFGTSEYALRCVPLLAGLVALPLFLFVARRVLAPATVPVALLSFAVSDQLIYYASEVKQYSSDVAVTLAILLFGFTVAARRLDWRTAVAGAACGAIAVWLSHPAIFVLAATGLVLLVCGIHKDEPDRDPVRPREFFARVLPLAMMGIVWVASFGAFYAVSLGGMAENRKRQRYWGDAFMPLTSEWGGWMKRTFVGLFADPGGFSPVWVAIALAAVGCGWLGWRNLRALSFLVAPVTLCLTASALRQYPFSDRLLLFLVPVLVLLAAAGVEAIARIKYAGPYLAAIAAVALLFEPSLAAARHLRHPRTREEIKPVLAWVRDRRAPGDTVYLYYGAQYPMAYYAERYGFAPGDYSSGKISRRNPDRYLRDLDELRGARRAWIVFSHPTTKRGVDEQQLFLDYLDKMGRRLDETHADGAAGYLYDLGIQEDERDGSG
jgi:hypothetical protein